jgi:hypothetical protein
VNRPALERDHERILHRVLGEVEVAEHADEGCGRPSRLAPEQANRYLSRVLYEAASAGAPCSWPS